MEDLAGEIFRVLSQRLTTFIKLSQFTQTWALRETSSFEFTLLLAVIAYFLDSCVVVVRCSS